MTFRFDLPDIDDSHALADWVEIMILISGKQQISRAQFVDALVAKIGASPTELDFQVAMLFKEIGRRRSVAGNGYPLLIDNKAIKRDFAANEAFYLFLLLVSLDGPMRRERRFKEIDQIFDEVVSKAVASYFGPGTNTLRFGWPPSGGRPTAWTKAVDWLSVSTGIPVGSGSSAPATKDGGLDVVAWKPFGDNRSAFATALVQCTVQSDWFPKATDLIDDVWRGRLDTGRAALTSLAIPFVIPKNYPKWDDLRRKVSVVFDRLRLAQMLADSSTAGFESMMSWSSTELGKFAV